MQHGEASVCEEGGESAGVAAGAGVEEDAELVEVEGGLWVYVFHVIFHADGQLEVVDNDLSEELYFDLPRFVCLAS